MGLKQGLASMLFNVALEYAVVNIPIDVNSTRFLKSTQVIRYTDNLKYNWHIVDICRRKPKLHPSEMGLKISENKTNCIKSFWTNCSDWRVQLWSGSWLCYLGCILSTNNDEVKEIQERLEGMCRGEPRMQWRGSVAVDASQGNYKMLEFGREEKLIRDAWKRPELNIGCSAIGKRSFQNMK